MLRGNDNKTDIGKENLNTIAKQFIYWNMLVGFPYFLYHIVSCH